VTDKSGEEEEGGADGGLRGADEGTDERMK